MLQSQDLFAKMILVAWESQNTRTTKLINSLSDDQFLSEVSPGRNRGIYLLGHLTAVNDSLITLLGLGEKLFPQYENIFIKNPDKSGIGMMDVAELKESWNKVTEFLKSRFKQMSSEDWFKRHMSVSDEDFAKEPHRNKLNVLISRTSHEAYHHGQLVLLQSK